MPKLKRVNKSKRDVVSDIQLVQDAERRRALIRDLLFPYLVGLEETIGYSKVFLQAFNGLVNGVFDESRKTTTLAQITDGLTKKLEQTFDLKEADQKREHDRYLKLIDVLKDVSIQDLTYATELGRYIDGLIVKTRDRDSISTISIDEILG